MCRYCHLHASSGCSTGTYVKAVLFRFQLSSSWYIHAGWLFTNDERKQAGLCLSYLFFFVLIHRWQVPALFMMLLRQVAALMVIFSWLWDADFLNFFYKQGLKTAVLKKQKIVLSKLTFGARFIKTAGTRSCCIWELLTLKGLRP